MRVQNYSEKANTNRKVYNYSTITSYTKANNEKYILKYCMVFDFTVVCLNFLCNVITNKHILENTLWKHH